MKKLSIFVIIVLICTVAIPLISVSASFHDWLSDSKPKIPSWIKNTARYWIEGQVSDLEFITALQWLVNENILKISDKETIETKSLNIPSSALFWLFPHPSDFDEDWKILSILYEVDDWRFSYNSEQVSDKMGIVYGDHFPGNYPETLNGVKVFIIKFKSKEYVEDKFNFITLNIFSDMPERIKIDFQNELINYCEGYGNGNNFAAACHKDNVIIGFSSNDEEHIKNAAVVTFKKI
jgi:hypothetical protein